MIQLYKSLDLNFLLTKRLIRKASIAAGRLLKQNQILLQVSGSQAFDVSSLTSKAQRKMVQILEVNPNDGITSLPHPKGKNGKWEYSLVALDDELEYFSSRTHYANGIALLRDNEPVFAAVMCPEQNQLFFAAQNQKSFRNNEQSNVNEVNSLNESSIAVVIHEKLKHREDITSTLLQNVLIKSGSMLTKDSYLFSCIQVASGQISGLIVLGVDYRHLCPGLLIVENAGGKVTDENGNKFSSKSEFCIVSNGRIHNDLLAILALQ